MKTAALILALGAFATPSFAGGMNDAVMEPMTIVEDTASSANDNWAGIVLTLLLVGAAL
ncbi:MAG: hypothetical protein WA822_06800 [Albidovulum sp.]